MTTAAAPKKLYLFRLSTTAIPLPGGQTLEMSSGSYLVETAHNKHILIDPSGPAPGHQPVLTRLPHSGPVLLAIDAAVLQRTLTVDRKAWPKDDNEQQLRASTKKLLDLVEREQIKLVVFGHDGQQWKSLKKSPDYYD